MSISATQKPAHRVSKSQPEFTRPPGLAQGRWLGDFEPLSNAEREFVTKSASGLFCILNDGFRPKRRYTSEWQPDSEFVIRAEIIRFLVLGGDAMHAVHENGIMLAGAWITGKLDLDSISTPYDISISNSRFETEIIAYSARLCGLYLAGSYCPGINGDRLQTTGNVQLQNNFLTTGEIRLCGARIGGNFSCSSGKFKNTGRVSLYCDGLKVTGDINFCDGFFAIGEVRLIGAAIGGDLNCSEGRISNRNRPALSADRMTIEGNVGLNDGFFAAGQVRLPGANVKGDVSCSEGHFYNPSGTALNISAAKITAGLFLRNLSISGTIDLTAAQVGTLLDDVAAWQSDFQMAPDENKSGHSLDGFRYDRIIGDTEASTRIAWLRTQHPIYLEHVNFAPQPWEQLIRILREMGHPHEAAKVAIAKQVLMRRAGKIGKPGTWWRPFTWGGYFQNGLHRIFGLLAGYGHQPVRTVICMLAVWLLTSPAYYIGRDQGLFGPTNSIIETGATSAFCGAPGDTMTVSPPLILQNTRKTSTIKPVKRKPFVWTNFQCTPPEYTSFQPETYSLDLLLPVVNLGQSNDWSPITSNNEGNYLYFGIFLRLLVWFEILFGWTTTLMLAAVLSNLVNKD